MKTPKLILIGAGPGDTGLITAKGLKALSTADIVLYDALANKELLQYAAENASKIFVGKRKNHHALSQDEINELIVALAKKHGHVVRLKGGAIASSGNIRHPPRLDLSGCTSTTRTGEYIRMYSS